MKSRLADTIEITTDDLRRLAARRAQLVRLNALARARGQSLAQLAIAWVLRDQRITSALIGASNHFEVAIATSVMLFGLSSGAALATVVGVLIEVPVMLMLVEICKRTRGGFVAAPS